MVIFAHTNIQQNLITNGDFRNFNLGRRSWGVINNLDGWKLSGNIELGNKLNYNNNWSSDVKTVMELDVHSNQSIS